ncbi:MAG: peptidase C39 family protein [Rhizobiaceae bacterium]|nr:peptidase C39 family protein [Rhizobiaceae bacterium]
MAQKLPFLCGPAALIRFLNWRGSSISNSLRNQIDIWRTANTIFMGQGAAGCDGAGLVRAADRLGETLTIVRTQPRFSFAGTVRDPLKKKVIAGVEHDNIAFARGRGLLGRFTGWDETMEELKARPLLVLCSMRAYSRSNEFHWIACRPARRGAELHDPLAGQYETGLDERFAASFRAEGMVPALSRVRRHVYDIIF